MPNKNKDDYQVGYGKPPDKTKFQRGKSGNSKGRPKGSQNLASVVVSEGRQLDKINGPNGARYIAKLRAGVRQVANKAAQGDLAAFRELRSSTQSFQDPVRTAEVEVV